VESFPFAFYSIHFIPKECKQRSLFELKCGAVISTFQRVGLGHLSWICVSLPHKFSCSCNDRMHIFRRVCACMYMYPFQAVRLAGTEEPQWRSAAVQQWAGSAAASSVGAAYLEAFETVLVAPLAEDTALVAATNESLKARAAVDKEFAHYVGKLAELRLQKADAKKLARNQVQCQKQ